MKLTEVQADLALQGFKEKLFKVHKKIIYAIEAVVDIALNSGPNPVQNESIARRQGIPKRYLEQTLQILVKNKILVGSRGPRGGYSLAKERRRIKIADIIKSVSNEDNLNSTFNSELSKKIVLPLINDISFKCLERFNNISIEEVCRIAKDKKLKQDIPKKVDFVI